MCSLALDVLKPQQAFVVGRDGANINLITQRTKATIHFPRNDVGHATTFFVQGTIDAILSARQHLVVSRCNFLKIRMGNPWVSF